MPRYPGTGNAVTRLLDPSYGLLQPFQRRKRRLVVGWGKKGDPPLLGDDYELEYY
jgi:hypothetical protein